MKQFQQQTDLSTSTASLESMNSLAGPSNMAAQEDLGSLNVEGGTVTPCVAFGNTSASTFGSLASKYGGSAGDIYEVTFNVAQLMQMGATENNIGTLNKVDTLAGRGHDADTDYIKVNGQEVIGMGAVPFLIRGGFNLGYDEQVTIEVGNNGLLCLDRLARSTMVLGQRFGATEDSGYTLDPGKNVEVMCAMRMGNAVKDVDARSDGFLAGVDPSNLRSRVQAAIYATFGASTADRVGMDMVTKPGIGIGETAMWANRYRDYEMDTGLSFSEQAAGRLNGDIGRLFVDTAGRPPETFINVAPDFSADIAKLFASNGTSSEFKMKAHIEFMAAVRDKLKASVDLSFLDNTDPGFKARFEQHFKDSMDEAFARTQNWSQMGIDEAWIHREHVYKVVPHEVEEVVAMVHDNSEGLQDGNAYFQMPNFSDWGMGPAVDEQEQTADAPQVDPVVAEAERQQNVYRQLHAFLLGEQGRLQNWDGTSRFHIAETPLVGRQPPEVQAVLDDLAANGGSNITNLTQITNKEAYAKVVEAWLALAIAGEAGGDITKEQADFDAACAAFKGG